MTNPRPFVAGANNTTYALVSGWNGFIWSVPYQFVMPKYDIIKNLTAEEYPVLNAIGLTLRVAAMHRVSDVFGPIVYSKYGDPENPGVYDSQEQAYDAFFADLDTAVAAITADPTNESFARFDFSYGGDVEKWGRFANSLRLRLAVRISKVDPVRAKIEGEKALAHPLGVMMDNSDSFFVNSQLAHPLATIDNSWGDIRMNASMESILTGLGDDRINSYFDASADYPGETKGIRNGLPLQEGYDDEIAQKGAYVGFSGLNESVKTSSAQLLTASEVYFLRAEAALRGWAGAGDAQSNYETGINTSFQQRGASVGGYISDNTSTPADYIDPVNAANNMAAMSNVTVAWDNAVGNEAKLEKIITQKWIAMFPEGQEAWSEYRRTGYPKIFPVVSNQSAGAVDTDIQIRRIPFVDNELSTNPTNVQTAAGYLNGPDNAGTRLWWDTGASNF
jgi:hypothetical protein